MSDVVLCEECGNYKLDSDTCDTCCHLDEIRRLEIKSTRQEAEIERLRGALLCGHCGGSGWLTLGVADTSIPCSYCHAYEIRRDAEKAGGE